MRALLSLRPNVSFCVWVYISQCLCACVWKCLCVCSGVNMLQTTHFRQHFRYCSISQTERKKSEKKLSRTIHLMAVLKICDVAWKWWTHEAFFRYGILMFHISFQLHSPLHPCTMCIYKLRFPFGFCFILFLLNWSIHFSAREKLNVCVDWRSLWIWAEN